MKRQRNGSAAKAKGGPTKKSKTSGGFTTKSVAFNPPRSKIQQPEKKNIDVNVNVPTNAGSSWTTGTLLNLVATGTTANQRLGRKVNYTSMEFKWDAFLDPTSIGGSPCRLVVVYDKQANGVLAVPGDVFEVDDYLSPMNLGNSERFIVLMDINTPPLSAQDDFDVSGKEFRKLNLDQVYNQTNGGTIADIQTGSIVFFTAQSGNVTVVPPTVQIYSRLRLIDN